MRSPMKFLAEGRQRRAAIAHEAMQRIQADPRAAIHISPVAITDLPHTGNFYEYGPFTPTNGSIGLHIASVQVKNNLDTTVQLRLRQRILAPEGDKRNGHLHYADAVTLRPGQTRSLQVGMQVLVQPDEALNWEIAGYEATVGTQAARVNFESDDNASVSIGRPMPLPDYSQIGV